MCRRASLIVGVLVLTSVCFSSLLVLPENTRAATLHVGGPGPGSYASIQAAIDAADPGDTVFVHSGTYNENVEVNKSVSLTGEDVQTTTVDGTGNGDAFRVTADWTNISGFTVIDDSSNKGITLWYVEHCRVSGNEVSTEYDYGIYLLGSNENVVTGNAVSSRADRAIYLHASDWNNITGNDADDSANSIHLWRSDGNNITGNSFSDNYDSGIWLETSSGNVVKGNNISGNHDEGIWLDDSSQNDVIGNDIKDNWNGILLEASSDNSIIGNNITGTWFEGMEVLFPSTGNVIHHNVFQNNDVNAWDEASNTWDNGTEGNYWDDYMGRDDNADGIGDVQHYIPGGGNKDRYPLMMSIANLEGSPTVMMGETIDFEPFDMTYDAGTIEKKSWDFDSSDGIQENAVGDAPSQAYFAGGVYTVTLTVVAERGYTTTDEMSVTVLDEVLISIHDNTGDVLNEAGKKVGGHPNIDLTNVTLWKVGDDILFEMNVVGTIQHAPYGSNAYVYAVFFFMDESDDTSNVDHSDFDLLSGIGLTGIENVRTGEIEFLEASGFGTSKLTILIPLWFLDYRTDFRINAMGAYYVGFDLWSETYDEAYLDWTVDTFDSSFLDMFFVAFVIIGLFVLPVALRLYLRSRKKKREVGPGGMGEDVVYYGPEQEGQPGSVPPPQRPPGRAPPPPSP